VKEVSQSFPRFFVQVIFPFQFKIAAKVQSAHLFIFRQLFSRAVLKYFSFDQQVCAIAD
jgi:hypothetical protein